jgi:AcrR family transcriptional regulator
MPRPLSTSARAKLLEAARELVAEGGPAAVTVDAVAKRSGVAKTTLYRHFENGHDLIVTALRDLPASIETPDTGDLRDDLVELVCRFTQLVNGPEMRRMILSVLSHATDDPDFADIHDILQKERRRPVMEVLEHARSPRPTDTRPRPRTRRRSHRRAVRTPPTHHRRTQRASRRRTNHRRATPGAHLRSITGSTTGPPTPLCLRSQGSASPTQTPQTLRGEP